jgi:dTDP-4-dehydrorhamnose reductase
VRKLLITGASGFLGWNLCGVARATWQVYGTTFTHDINIPGIATINLDLGDFKQLKHCFATLQPDAVVHLAAASKPNYCQVHPHESYRLNVSVAEEIAACCAEAAIPLAFTSTDLVFDGLTPPYKETDPVSPICIYGEHKAQAEQRVLARYPQAAVCRMPLMFGRASPVAESFIQGFIRTLQKGEEIHLFTDEYRATTSATTAAKGLLLALDSVAGLIHLGGKERLSRYEFGVLMAEVLGLPVSLIKPCQQQDVTMSAPRPPDVTLDSAKAFALGYAPLSLREELQLCFAPG